LSYISAIVELMNQDSTQDPTNDFDFLAGSWNIHHRRLKQRHVGSSEWDEFSGISQVRLLLGGVMNVDENIFPSLGWSGATVRIFNRQTQQWSIYWVNSAEGRLQAPVVGRFEDNVGEFFGDDTDQGLPIKVRYRWRRQGTDQAHWDQAFSWDGGETWETNWTMAFNRAAWPGRP